MEGLALKLDRRDDCLSGLQHTVDEITASWVAPRVLEAGCGSLERVRFAPDAHVVGMDIEPVRIENNSTIDEGIVGDVETYDFEPESFDAVVCWYVFEHLHDPLAALVRFAKALRPGGILVLAFPNLLSPKGLVTKFTPFSLHVFFRRRILGRVNAGQPGKGPYPTTLPFALTPPTVLKLAAAADLEVAFASTHEDMKQEEFRRRLHMPAAAWRVFARLVTRLTRGHLDAERTEVLLVFRKRF